MLILKHVTKNRPVNLYEDLNVTFNQSEMTYLIFGEVGSGKTTLLRLLFGLEIGYQGKYTFFGRDANKLTDSDWQKNRAEKIQFVFQEGNLIPFLTVEETLLFIQPRPDILEVNKLLQIVDLDQHATKKVENLSGGQKQRLSIARALVHHPDVLLLDEPSGNLDDKHFKEMMDYLEHCKNQGMMLIIVSHDSRMIKYADCILTLSDKQLSIQKFVNKTTKNDTDRPTGAGNNFQWMKYVLTDLRCQSLNYIKNSIPMIVLLTIFVAIEILTKNNEMFVSNSMNYVLLGISLIFGSLVIIMGHSTMQLRYKNFSILLTQGCSRRDIIKIIGVENIILLNVCFLFSLILCWIMSQKIKMMFFTSENLLLTVGSLFIIIFLMTAWSTKEVLAKKILKY